MKKTLTLIAILTSLLMLIIVAGCGAANGFTASKSAGGYTVELQSDHNPLVAGDNAMQIAITDAKGAVTDAQVKVVASMPAMPGMPAMSGTSKTELSGKTYNGNVELMMAGSWTLSVVIDRNGAKQKIDFAVDAH